MARLPDSFIEELRARTPIAALVGRRVKLSRSGRNWKGCCPFHAEKTPSFYVYDDGYHCFGCGAHGDAIRFAMDTGGGSFIEAVEQLAGEAGLEVPKPSPQAAAADRQRLDLHGILDQAAVFYQKTLFSPAGAVALAYLRGRGLTDDTIRHFGLGYAGDGALPRHIEGAMPHQLREAGLLRENEDGSPGREQFFNRVMFPIRDRRGRVISFGGRTLGDGQPKYVNGPETVLFSKRRTLYGLDLAREAARGGAPIVAVEGYMDVIALHQAGFGGAVAPLGTALTDEQLDALWALCDAPVLCFDGDAAGARAAARAASLALPSLTPARTVRIATLPAGEDPDTLVRGRGRAAFSAILESAPPLFESLFGLLRETGPADTPEQRAAFRARLEAAAGRIADRGLAAEYRRTLLDRYFASFRTAPRGGHRAQPGPAMRRLPARQRPEEAAGDVERIRHMAAIMLRHPQLVPRVEEAFSALHLPPQAARLLAATQLALDGWESLDSNGLTAHLTDLLLADDVAWALGELPLPLPACAKAVATHAEAEAGWWSIYGFMWPGGLRAELEAARRDCAERFTAEAVQRLAALAAAVYERAGDGAAGSGLEE